MLRSSVAGALLLGTLGTLGTLGASPAGAQSDLPARGAPLAQRVSAARDGTVRLTFTTRPDVCSDGRNGVRIGRRDVGRTYVDDNSRRARDVEWDDDCQQGPGRLALDVRGGQVQALRFYVGGRWRPAGADVTDLGQVPAEQAAGLLLG